MVSATSSAEKPTHHITLETVDGATKIGLMLCDSAGRDDPLAITQSAYPRTSTRIAQGDNKYSDFEPPYKPIVQEDWVGGRGAADFEKDTTRYYDGWMVNTEHGNQIILGGRPTYGLGYANQNIDLPGSVVFFACYGTTRYYAVRVTVGSTGYTAYSIGLWLRKVGSPGNATLCLYSDSAGNPGTLLQNNVVSASLFTDTVSEYRHFANFSTALTAATNYWIVFIANASDDVTNHFTIGSDDTGTGKQSANGSSWSGASAEAYYRIFPSIALRGKYFEYKRCLYFVTIPNDGSSSALYINGQRGAADSNVANKGRLYDGTNPTWVSDITNSRCVALIIDGPGSDEVQPWRFITGTATGYLTVSPDWKVTHTTETNYVILGSDVWTKLKDFTAPVTDVAVADEIVYFACGKGRAVRRYCERNEGGAWTLMPSSTTEPISEPVAQADLLAVTQEADQSVILWGLMKYHAKFTKAVFKGKVPKNPNSDQFATAGYFALYQEQGILADTDLAWGERTATGITVSRDEGDLKITGGGGWTGAGVAASIQLDTPVDITKAKKLGLLYKTDIVLGAGDVKLQYDDTKRLGMTQIPDYLFHYDDAKSPSGMYHYNNYLRPSKVVAGDYHTGTYDFADIWQLSDDDLSTTFNRVFVGGTNKDYLYVGYDMPILGIYVDLVPGNTVDSTMTVEYNQDGDAWAAVGSLSDGTKSGADSMAVDGLISWTAPNDQIKGPPDANSPTGETTNLDPTLFWYRIYWNATLDAVTINELTCYGTSSAADPEARHFQPMANSGDTDPTTESIVTLYKYDRIYIQGDNPFNLVRVRMGSDTNATAATLSAKYWNGKAWVSLTITDGTASGGATLKISGNITFTQPVNWEPGIGSQEDEVLDDEKYTIYLEASANLDSASIVTISLEDTEISRYIPLNRCKDGDTATSQKITWHSNDYIIVMASEKFNKVNFNIGSPANQITATLSAKYFNGQLATLQINDGTASGGKTMAVDGDVLFTIPHDWEQMTINGVTGYPVWFSVNTSLSGLSDPEVPIDIVEIAVKKDDVVSVNLPANTTTRWQFVELSISPNENPNPDEKLIKSVGLYVTPSGAFNFWLSGGILLLDDTPKYIRVGTANESLNGIIPYGEEKPNPLVFSDQKIYEIQTENDDAVVPVPLEELAGLRSETNGIAHTTNDVYLYFNLGRHIERYHERTLDDVGPDRDEGLPTNRQGDVSFLLSYPGRVYAGIDAGDSGYSSVLVRREGGWHEVYRAPYGDRIYNAYVQVIPGYLVTKLWVNCETGLLWVPLPKSSFNPIGEINSGYYKVSHEGYLITPWISAGFLDISKFFKSIKLFSEYLLSTTQQYAQVEYQLDEEGNTWSTITDTFITSPFQEILISNNYDKTARRIRLRLRLFTTNDGATPLIKAWVLEALMRMPVKYSYTLRFRIRDAEVDLQGERDHTARAETLFTQIKTWADAPTVLKLRSNYSLFDTKYVVIEPPGIKPISPHLISDQHEQHLAEVTLLEV